MAMARVMTRSGFFEGTLPLTGERRHGTGRHDRQRAPRYGTKKPSHCATVYIPFPDGSRIHGFDHFRAAGGLTLTTAAES